jgi:hypothetical protein
VQVKRPPLDIWSEIRRTSVLVDRQTRLSDLDKAIGRYTLGIEDAVPLDELINRFTELQSAAGILSRLIFDLDRELGFDTKKELGVAGHLLDRGRPQHQPDN